MPFPFTVIISRLLGYERVYLPLYIVPDTSFHIQGEVIFTYVRIGIQTQTRLISLSSYFGGRSHVQGGGECCSMFRRFNVPKGLYSEGFMFRRSYFPKVLYSEDSMLRRFYILKVLCSENPLPAAFFYLPTKYT